MLYDNDSENEGQDLQVIDELNKTSLRKKTIICGIIILCCVIVMTVSICISVNNKDAAPKVAKKKLPQYEGTHMQIVKHNPEQIKNNFVPIYNPNAQQDITNIYYSEEKVAYLTFDDGPSKNVTPQILDILKQENVPATFFVLGSRVDLYPDILKREYDEGHYIANHGYSHKYSQIYASKDTVFDEYIKCENAIRNALGNQSYNTYLFRFPGGSSGGRYSSVKSEAKGLLNMYGVNYTNWNSMTGDAEGKTTPEEIMSCLQQTMQGDGSLIILLHDASDKSYTVETLPAVISYLREQGYTFKNFFEIF